MCNTHTNDFFVFHFNFLCLVCALSLNWHFSTVECIRSAIPYFCDTSCRRKVFLLSQYYEKSSDVFLGKYLNDTCIICFWISQSTISPSFIFCSVGKSILYTIVASVKTLSQCAQAKSVYFCKEPLPYKAVVFVSLAHACEVDTSLGSTK